MRINSKKGFTLIELLAVIVILAVIIVIAVPNIIGVINESKIKAFDSNAKLVVRTVELERVKNNNLNLTDIKPDTMQETLGIPGDNYADLNVSLENDQVKIVAVGKENFAGLIASGTKENITIVKSDDYESPIMALNGSNPMTIEKGGTYTELNATATDNNDGNISANITITGSVDTNMVGSYTITYSVSDSNSNVATITRTVNVVDVTLPAVVFETNGNDTYAKTRSTKVTVTDISGINSSSLKYQWTTSITSPTEASFASTLTNEEVISTPSDVTGDYYLWILAKDNLNNTTIINSNVFKLDNIKPVITLTENSTITINKDTVYTDAGATAADNIDGTITNNIITVSSVVPSIVGTYTVTYNVTDSSGNVADTITRTVNVVLPIMVFNKTFGGTGVDVFNDLKALSDGYIVVGNSASTDGDQTGLNKSLQDAIIIRYGSTGNVVWKKTFGGNGFDDNFKAVTVTAANDGYIAVGESRSTNVDLSGLNKGSTDAIIVKYDTSGNVVWKKTFGGTGMDYFNNIINITNGYIVVGYAASTDVDLSGLNKGGYDAIIVKYDLSGNVVWKKNFGGTGYDNFCGVDELSDGYVAVGFSQSTNNDLLGLNKGQDDAIIVKYDTSGNVVWKKTFGGTANENFYSVALVNSNIIATGYSNSTTNDFAGLNKGGYDAVIVKYDLSGNIVWNKNYGGTKVDYFQNMKAVADGYIAAGYNNSTDVDLTGLNKGGYDATLVKYDFNGNVVWNKNYGGTLADQFNNFVINNGNYITVGKSASNDGDLNGLNKGSDDAIIFEIRGS